MAKWYVYSILLTGVVAASAACTKSFLRFHTISTKRPAAIYSSPNMSSDLNNGTGDGGPLFVSATPPKIDPLAPAPHSEF